MKKETIFPNKSFDWFLLQPPIYQTEDINLQLLINEFNNPGRIEKHAQKVFADFVGIFFDGRKGKYQFNEKYYSYTIDGVYPRMRAGSIVSNDIETLKKITGADEPIAVYCSNKHLDKIVPFITQNPYITLVSLKEFEKEQYVLSKEYENYIFVLYQNDIVPITMCEYDVIELKEKGGKINIQLCFGIFVKRIQRQILIDLN
jgi:hypothetical protein